MTDHTTHFDDCGCKTAALNDAARINAELRRDLTAARDNSSNMAVEVGALRAERDALRLRVAALEAAGNAMRPLLIGRSFEEYGCQFCGKYLCAPDCKVKQAENAWTAALSGDTTALRAMLVEAFDAGFRTRDNGEPWDGYEDGEAYVSRILGASKGGGA